MCKQLEDEGDPAKLLEQAEVQHGWWFWICLKFKLFLMDGTKVNHHFETGWYVWNLFLLRLKQNPSGDDDDDDDKDMDTVRSSP